MTFQLTDSINRSLLTWYKPDNPLYRDTEHPTIKLAGEIGELLDLYAKHKYKPDFYWTDCKHCKGSKDYHSELDHCVNFNGQPIENFYTSLVLDELGDVWYYLRILAWMGEFNYQMPNQDVIGDDLACIVKMYQYASELLTARFDECEEFLHRIYFYLNIILDNLDCPITSLTMMNYAKLNLQDDNNHGWGKA